MKLQSRSPMVWALIAILGPVVFTLFFYITTLLLSLFWSLESAPITILADVIHKADQDPRPTSAPQ